MLVNTTTPDGYEVGIDGAWIEEESEFPVAEYYKYQGDNGIYLDESWNFETANYGTITFDKSDLINHGDYYEIKNQELRALVEHEKKAPLNYNGWTDVDSVVLPNGKYAYFTDSVFIEKYPVYNGSFYANKDITVILYDWEGGNYEYKIIALSDYFNNVSNISNSQIDSFIGLIGEVDSNGYITQIVLRQWG